MSEYKTVEIYSIDESGNVSVTLKKDTTVTLGQINIFIDALKDENERLKKLNEETDEDLNNLQKELGDLQEENENILVHNDILIVENERLKKQNEKYREALEFYASGDSWGHLNQDSIEYYIVDISDSGTGEFDLNSITDDNRVGGRRAREALKDEGNEG